MFNVVACVIKMTYHIASHYLVISSLYFARPLQTKLAVRFLILGSQGTTQLKSAVMFW